MLALIKSFQIDETGFRLDFVGGRRLEYRHEVEAPAPPSRPSLAKCAATVPATCVVLEDNVVPLRSRRSA